MSDYIFLRSLKNMPKRVIEAYQNLEARKTPSSKNILIICRSKEEARNAMRRFAQNMPGCKVHSSNLRIEMSDRNIYFISSADVSFNITGLRYKEYYFEEDI